MERASHVFLLINGTFSEIKKLKFRHLSKPISENYTMLLTSSTCVTVRTPGEFLIAKPTCTVEQTRSQMLVRMTQFCMSVSL